MDLVLYVAGEQLDRVPLLHSDKLSLLMAELKKKHSDAIKDRPDAFAFVLENVPSAINGFKSILEQPAAK